MRILQLCKKFPYPLKDGESIAVTHLSKALHQLGCEVTLLSMNTTKHYCEVDRLPEDFNHYQAIHYVNIDNRVQIFDAFLNLFSSQSYHITRFQSKEFENTLIEVLKNEVFDIIQLETPVLSGYIPVIRKYSKALIVMRSHNVEHEIWGRIAENKRYLPVRWYFEKVAEKLRRFEMSHLNDYDMVLAITTRDLHKLKDLGLKKPALVIPIGLDVREYIPVINGIQKSPSLSFIGSLDWMPNQEGLKWFLDRVWPVLQSRFPGLSFHIAGRNTPDWVTKIQMDGVQVHGEVTDSVEFINQHPIMVVPLLSGSGMRVKILEGMALRKSIVTTSIGAEGIECEDGEELLVADTAEAFINRISFLIKNPAAAKSIGSKALEFISANYDNLHIAQRLIQAYRGKVFKKTTFQKNLPVE